MNERLVLIDTSVWIQVLKRDPPPALAETVRQTILNRRAATTGVVMLELLGGVRTERDYRELSEELRALHYLPTEKAWPEAWQLSFRLRRHGMTVPSADVLIAAVAIAHQCTLFHADKHFAVIARNSTLQTREA
jgi:predicted nucleic acid-binding protein